MRSSRLFFHDAVTGRMRCAIFLLLASLRAAAGAAGDYCASDFPDDVYTESCYGWCDVLNSESHCAYCKCRGCAFCAAASSPAAGGGGADVCESGQQGDIHYRDCAGFCSEEYKSSHCSLCKCKACGFCTCADDEGDGQEESCEGWCAAEFADSHCKSCKCKGCEMCAHGGARVCFSGLDGDSECAARNSRRNSLRNSV